MANHALDTVSSHAKANRGTYMINLFGSVIPIIMFLVYASTQIGGLATEKEVKSYITEHTEEGMHPDAKRAVGEVQGQLDSILSFQIEERIEKQIKVVCTNPELRDALEPSIKQLIRDFNKVSPRPYTRPSCAQLGVG